MNSYVEHSIREVCDANKDIVSKIFDHAFSLRDDTTFSMRPFQLPPYADRIGDQGLDFSKLYPHFKEGDYVYIQCCMDGAFERDMMLLIQKTDNPEVYFNGEKQEVVQGPCGKDVYVRFNKGVNRILIKVTAKQDSFAAYVLPIVPGIRYIACGEYQYRTWQYIDKKGAEKQEGFEISRLYCAEESEPAVLGTDIEWIFPVIPEMSDDISFDFETVCAKGKAAYVYTNVKGKIVVEHDSPLKVFLEKEEIYCEKEGKFIAEYTDLTPLLFKSLRGKDSWGFRVGYCDACDLPFVEGCCTPDLRWMWIGPFGQKMDSVDTPYGPEVNLTFEQPYTSVCQGKLFWRFHREKTYLKYYNHTAFFGQWYYAIMVGHTYMLQAAKMLGRTEFYSFFEKSIKCMCAHRDYCTSFKKQYGDYDAYLAGSMKLDRLDPIGTIGVNVAEYYMMSADSDARLILEKLANAIRHDVPRFEDGTFHRGETMWTDDMYMSLPFLARLGRILGDQSRFDDILNQVRGFSKRMYMEDCDLFSHIYFVENHIPNRIPWGRGNGWVLLALSEVLLILPDDYHGKDEILALYRKLAKGVLQHRDKDALLWHQVINNPESYIETSGSAMFIAALARGITNGWIDAVYKETVLESWESLCENCIDTQGNVYGVCKGSSCSMDEKYYLKLETMKNDDHGVGIVLIAGIEVMNMQETIMTE